MSEEKWVQFFNQPDIWENVTDHYELFDGEAVLPLMKQDRFKFIDGQHNGPAFIIERRKP